MRVLILGGTTEATQLAKQVAAAGIDAVISFAGRVARPADHPVPRRIGGFGGVPGLVAYLRDAEITHVIDATHPFAAQMSHNAVDACTELGRPLIALTRTAWTAVPGDRWTHVPDIEAAVAALAGPPRRVMLAIGRMHLDAFAPMPQHFYVLRLVDPPRHPPPLPNRAIVVARGPFTLKEDQALLEHHGIDLIVAKNAGGTASRAKIDAARSLGLPVVMIDRPKQPQRQDVTSPAAAMDWLTGGAPTRAAHDATARGV